MRPTVTAQTGSPDEHMEHLHLGDADCPSPAGTHPGLSVPSCGWTAGSASQEVCPRSLHCGWLGRLLARWPHFQGEVLEPWSRIKDSGEASAPEGPLPPESCLKVPTALRQAGHHLLLPREGAWPPEATWCQLGRGTPPLGTRDLAWVEAYLTPYRWGRWAGAWGGAGAGLDMTIRAGSLP